VLIEESALSRLPGYELYRAGMDSLQKGDFNSASALLIRMASTRLARVGLPIPQSSQTIPVHLEFYSQLENRYPDSHFRYNASLQRLDKFCRAVERLGSV
jgi:hypothetical protein